MTAEVVITYNAKEQFNRLSKQEQAELMRVLSEPDRLKRSQQVGGTSGYVSRFGQDKRAYWTLGDGQVLVLSIVARNTLAA
jgi:hypothetical protein